MIIDGVRILIEGPISAMLFLIVLLENVIEKLWFYSKAINIAPPELALALYIYVLLISKIF